MTDGLGDRRSAPQPDTAAENRLAARFTDALERGDLDALIELLVADVRLSMPPAMLEYRGIESARRLFGAVVFRPFRTYRVMSTRANHQPAFGVYLADRQASVFRAHTLPVITVASEHITAVTGFNNTTLMARFGLPPTPARSRLRVFVRVEDFSAPYNRMRKVGVEFITETR